MNEMQICNIGINCSNNISSEHIIFKVIIIFAAKRTISSCSIIVRSKEGCYGEEIESNMDKLAI